MVHQPSLGILPLLIELAASSAVITSLAIGPRSSTSVVACHNNSHHFIIISSSHHHSRSTTTTACAVSPPGKSNKNSNWRGNATF